MRSWIPLLMIGLSMFVLVLSSCLVGCSVLNYIYGIEFSRSTMTPIIRKSFVAGLGAGISSLVVVIVGGGWRSDK